MWSNGTIWTENGKVGYDYWIKHYDEPSETFGLDGGKISKLLIRKHGKTEDLVAYERSWDTHCPNENEIKAVYALLIEKYN